MTGLDRLVADNFQSLKNQKVGLLVHPASVDSRLRHARDVFLEAEVNVCTLFGPQHGLMGQTQDNMIEWEGGQETGTGIPIHSLYGEHRKPTAEMLAGLDVLVVDLQDVGARYYTFIWTMLLCMEACAEAGVAVMVLDRPNPLGGVMTEGNVLDLEYKSFVGLAPIPMRHSLTIGEMALFFRHWAELEVELEVVTCKNLHRRSSFATNGLPWVFPSPNMPTLDTAFVYPGGCLLEGTQLSEGRGTTRPFEIFGAPYVDGRALADHLTSLKLPGATYRPLEFEPTFHKFAGQVCGGIQVHVQDRLKFESVLVYTAAISFIRQMWPDEFAWKEPPYEYETVKLPIDILAGGQSWRQDVEAGRDPWAMKKEWDSKLLPFGILTEGFRQYGG
ncbi:MAG: DUF1343 domain-containing protein [bacterium]|nr:DUF1343 domain-containing protein [bacterium]